MLAAIVAAGTGLTISSAYSADQAGPVPLTTAQDFYAGLDPRDVARASEAVQGALEHDASGAERRWRDDGSGVSGSVRPLRTFKTTEGRFCRVFQEAVLTGQGERSAQRLACRDENGRWREAEFSDAPPA